MPLGLICFNPECRYFCRKIFSGILLEKIGKNYATVYAFGTPIRPRHRASTQQGVEALAPHDLTPSRDALQIFSASLRKPARRYGYRGLKIFTSLTLRFQDFQRWILSFGHAQIRLERI